MSAKLQTIRPEVDPGSRGRQFGVALPARWLAPPTLFRDFGRRLRRRRASSSIFDEALRRKRESDSSVQHSPGHRDEPIVTPEACPHLTLD
jgi:hypothetical protein